MNKHQPLDKEEQMIYEAFAEINVDTTSLKSKMKKSSYEKTKRPMKLSFAMMAMVALLVVSGTVYAATGGLAELIERFNPNFGEYAVAPLEPLYSEDQGIRFEVYGTGAFDNTLLIYYSIQDLSGENRLSEQTSPGRYHIFYGENDSFSGAFTRLLHFDIDTNTLFYEAIITVHTPFTSQITIGLENIYDVSQSGVVVNQPVIIQGDWQVVISLDDIEDSIILLEDITEKNISVSRMVISPFGVHIDGVSIIRSHPQDQERRANPRPWPDVEIELFCDNHAKIVAAGGGNPGDSTFIRTDSPINPEEVTAIIIYGTRIPIP